MNDEKVLASLKRIEEWLAVIARAHLAPLSNTELADPKMAELYTLTGEKPIAEIQKKLRLGPNTISETWKRWAAMGLLVKEGKRYRKVL